MTLRFAKNNNIVQVTGIDGSPPNGKLEIPGSCSLGPVEEIKDSAFENNQEITSVYIGNGIKRILHGAFEYCKNIRYISIPETVTLIFNNAFLLVGSGYIDASITTVFEGNSQIEEIHSYALDGVREQIVYFCGQTAPVKFERVFKDVQNVIVYSNTVTSFCGVTTKNNNNMLCNFNLNLKPQTKSKCCVCTKYKRPTLRCGINILLMTAIHS